MSQTTVPQEVEVFLHDHIESYEQLEILLLLQREAATAWTADQIGLRLNISSVLATEALNSLRAAHLVGPGVDQAATEYRYAPADRSVRETIGSLAHAYITNPIGVIKLMSANAILRMRTGALRAFADAFVIRKVNDDNG